MFKKVSFSCHSIIFSSLCMLLCSFQLTAHNNEVNREKILHFLSGEWISRGIYVATKLNIPDWLEEGPKSVEEIAALASTDSDSLYRLSHLLASHGISKEVENRIFKA